MPSKPVAEAAQGHVLHPRTSGADAPPAVRLPGPGIWAAVRPYVQIARFDHWFKNAFMVLGMLLAFFYRPETFGVEAIPVLGLAILATGLVASSNYVINEYLDAPFDRTHPTKYLRPAAAGLVKGPLVIGLWLLLAATGIGISFGINIYFGVSALALWIMGCAYNIRPVRLKDIPYFDVLSESVNNPIRLFLGWHALIDDLLPPFSLVLAYWMAGAFFMATKRFAEYRSIGSKAIAAGYRKSFAHYDDNRLLVSMFFYVTTCALFGGVFIVRYKLELILHVPFAAGFFAYYLHLGLKQNSAVQTPEKLYREWGFFGYAIGMSVLFVALMFSDVPVLYELFNVSPSTVEPLWRIGQ